MVLVDSSNLQEVLTTLLTKRQLAVDSETSGVRPYHKDRLFSIAIASDDTTYYFDFNTFGMPLDKVKDLQVLFDDPTRVLFLHNAKFDLAFLHKEGLTVNCIIHDTMVVARILYNDYKKYSLDACAERIGLKKDDKVKEYVLKNRLWEWEPIPGKKGRNKLMHFDLVPLDLIQPYAEQDARITYDLAMHQLWALRTEKIKTVSKPNWPLLDNIYHMENKVTKVCFDMEQVGIKINRHYCEEAIAFEDGNIKAFEQSFLDLTGVPFKDSGKYLAPILERFGIEIELTEKGNPQITDEFLDRTPHQVAKVIQSHRSASKRANTYFKNFLYHADANDYIHASILTSGTASGRMASRAPNLQNLHKEDTSIFPIRGAFVPDKDFLFLSIDYDQMEYRMMLDCAEEMKLIDKVKNGLDIHTATAQMMGTDRKSAKTLNFMLLYGGGIQALADALGIRYVEAQSLKNDYFEALPNVQRFIYQVKNTAKERKYIYNWLGRRCHFEKAEFTYKAPNYLIQGGCADIVKRAMISVHELLLNKKSKILVQVHDELGLHIHKDELHLIPEIKNLMEKAYPYRHLPMSCSASHSFKSWGDLVDGIPSNFSDGSEERNEVSDKSN